MKLFRFTAMAALLAAAWCAPYAEAQTQNINSVSGQGQLICPTCAASAIQQFDPLVVKVTDASGNPVVNATVTWTLTQGQGGLGPVNGSTVGTVYTSTTDSTGSTSSSYFEPFLNIANTAQPYLQSQIVAQTTTSSFTFYETETAIGSPNANSNGFQLINVQMDTPSTTPPCPSCPNYGNSDSPVTGPAGSTASQQIVANIYTIPGSAVTTVPFVEIHLIPNQTSPTIACATGSGADPGAVMTDQFGNATCNLVFGPTTGAGTFFVTVGGVSPSPVTTGVFGFFTSGNYYFNVLPGQPGTLVSHSGNAQSANPGQVLPLPLVAVVGDQNGNPLSGQQVTWSVSPTGAASLTNTTTTSDANGQVKTNVTFSNSAVGAVTITAALTSNTKLAAVFTETANIQVTGLSIVSGNKQTAIVGAAFASPLIVQLTTSTGAPTANVPVQFTLTGPGTLSTPSAQTASNGQAQVTVTAGSAAGTITVTASSGSFSQTFTLTVIPPGPSLTVNSFYNGADFQRGSISPCSIATIIAPGIAPSLQGAVEAGMVGALPYLMAGDSVTINGSQAPIFNVANTNNQQQITFQVPCGLTPGQATVTVNVNGGTASISVPLNPASPGIFGVQQSNGAYLPVLVRPDGSFVSAQNPARIGEVVIAFVTGLGPTTPAVATNSLPIPGSAAAVQGTVIVGYSQNGVANGLVPISAVLSPDLVAVYEVAFQVPTTVSAGNIGFSIGLLPQGAATAYYSVLGTFPVQ